MTKTYEIKAKMGNSGTIHDIAGEYDRVIRFGAGCKWAVVLASYYGGKGYTTHRTEAAAIAQSKRVSDYSHEIIDDQGNVYAAQAWQDELVRI